MDAKRTAAIVLASGLVIGTGTVAFAAAGGISFTTSPPTADHISLVNDSGPTSSTISDDNEPTTATLTPGTASSDGHDESTEPSDDHEGSTTTSSTSSTTSSTSSTTMAPCTSASTTMAPPGKDEDGSEKADDDGCQSSQHASDDGSHESDDDGAHATSATVGSTPTTVRHEADDGGGSGDD